IGGPGGLAAVRDAAARLGAAIAATRDVTDAGWLPKQHQVGLTGRAIAPRVYVALGVSGAMEHLVGVRRAGVIVAVNTKPKAPNVPAARNVAIRKPNMNRAKNTARTPCRSTA